jgi:hypothetical protein
VVSSAVPTFAALEATDRLSHFRARGGHPLDRARFAAIVDWLATMGA